MICKYLRDRFIIAVGLILASLYGPCQHCIAGHIIKDYKQALEYHIIVVPLGFYRVDTVNCLPNSCRNNARRVNAGISDGA